MQNIDQEIAEMVARIPLNIETKKDVDIETEIKTIRDEIIAKVGGNATAMAAMQVQLDALDRKLAERHAGGGGEGKSLSDVLKENESVSRLLRDRKGRAVISLEGPQAKLLDRKTVFLSSSTGTQPTTSVLRIDRMPGITLEARQALTIRDVLNAAPTTMQVIDYVKVATPLSIASPQVEGSTKAENAVTFTSLSERVKTIATFIRASRQILEDFGELSTFLDTGLSYYTNYAEEQQLLSGNATGENLNGLLTQAQAFNTGLLSAPAGWNRMDIVGRTVQQITANKEIQPTFCVMHPNDWWAIRLTKDGFGRYILGDPQTMVEPSLFGLRVVSTTTIGAGTFLVGSGEPEAAQIRDRAETVVDISTEDANNFTTNLVTVRVEKRLALVVRRPNSFVTGGFVTSPVS